MRRTGPERHGGLADVLDDHLPGRFRTAQGHQDARGVEHQPSPLPQQPGSLGNPAAGSHHKLAPHSDTARSKLPDGSGTSPASASMSGKKMPDRSWQRRAEASCAGVRSTPVGRAPRLASQAEKYAVPQPSSTTFRLRTSPSTPSCCSGTLKMPHVMSSAAQAR